MSRLEDIDAVTLDVGGVFVVPSHDRLEQALRAAGLDVERTRFWDGHYRAMHAVDVARSAPETFGDYVPAFCHHLGLRDDDHAAAVEAIEPMFGPSGLWCEPIAESVEAIRQLDDAGIEMAVVSNADGTVDQILVEAGVCQVGEGPLVSVVTIVDSGAAGVAKPHPGIFELALDALGTTPERTLHVGDSVHYDVVGAQAAGLRAAHFDPRGLCEDDSHEHLRSLLDLLA